MMKWLMYLLLVVLVAGSWHLYSKKGAEMDKLKQTLVQLRDAGDANDEEKIAKMQADLDSKENERTFSGILVTFLAAGLAGIFVVVTVLPFFAQRLTHAIYDSGEMVEKDAMHDARSLMAQGDYEGAIAAYKQAAAADPLNRLPWVEIAKIQKDTLDDPAAAIATIRHALESQEWEVNDAAYFLFRLAELYDEVNGDRTSAMAIMNQVIEQFPNTRHSANANHKLHEWAVEAEGGAVANEEARYLAQAAQAAKTTEEEEAEFLARMKKQSAPKDDSDQPGGV
jgi:tetratricopeptide (TPR) repeat protein